MISNRVLSGMRPTGALHLGHYHGVLKNWIRLQHEKRRTIGIRVPDHEVPRLLLAELGEPIMSSTLLLPGDELPLTDGREIRERLEHQVDCVLDGGHCGIEPTTVVDLAVTPPTVTRIGRGPLETLGI